MKYFEQFFEWLESLGFEILRAGGQCPWQLCLNHSSGYSVYCRSRHARFDFEIYDVPMGEDLPDDDHLIYESSLENWDEPDAGYIDTQTAWQCFYACWSEAKEAIADD